MSKKKVLIICVGIIAVTVALVAFIFMSEPTAQSEGATKKSAMLVEVIEAEHGDFTPTIVATGTVRPEEDVIVSPLVSGQVTRRYENFVPGGFVPEGSVILQLDPSDYRNSLNSRQADLELAESGLEIEMGRQYIAQQDLKLVQGDTLPQDQKDLVLRKPQLNSVKATIASAKAAVEQARLQLSRTTIKAPFDAYVITQNVTLGSQVAPGDDLGRIVGTQNYFVEASVPIASLKWLSFPEDKEEKGSVAIIQNPTGWAANETREGYLFKQIGALDNNTRLARVLVRIPDPLSRKREHENQPKFIIGSFVEAKITGKTIKDVTRIPRDLVRTNNTVWVMEQDKLRIAQTTIAFTDAQYAYISEGLEGGAQVVTTNLSTVTNDIPLRTEKDSIPSSQTNQP